MAWRWISTPLSADRGEVSVLAVVETIIAMSISLGIAWYWQTLTHIAVSACLAPVLLLRSRRSVLVGMVFFAKLTHSLRKIDRNIDINIKNIPLVPQIKYFLSSNLVFVLVLFVFPVASRLFSLLYIFSINPISVLENLPFNWFRVVFCLDCGNVPELVPGVERLSGGKWLKKEESSIFEIIGIRFVDYYHDFRLRDNSHFMIAGYVFAYVGFLFSLSYRWSLKSTSLIWSPLLWIIARARTIGPVRFRLQNICNTALYKIMRWYSAAALLLFTWKLVI